MACMLTWSLAVVLAASGPASAQAPVGPDVPTRVIYVTVTDRNGNLIDDLSTTDFVVKEGGKEREVLLAGPATIPMRIALLIDDNGSGIFRYGVVKFIEKMQGRAEFALSTVNGQHLKLVDYTANADDLVQAIARLTVRPGTTDGGQLLEGIFETAKDLEKRKARRAVIVVLTVGGEEHSPLPASHVLDQLQKSGAALNVISVSSSALRSMAAVQKPSGLLGENMNLSEVLGDGPKQSGGRTDEIVATAGIVSGLQVLAEALTHQYAIAYARPAKPNSSDKVSVSVKRPGLSVLAPARVPAR